jgi:hypothetical protein
MSLKAKDKIFLALGGLAFVLTSTWAFLQQSKISNLGTAVSVPTSGSAYEKREIKVAMPPSQSWAKAGAQPAGEKWIYNVFTPPKIFYNTQTKQFTVIPPEQVTVDPIGTTPVGPVIPTVIRPDLELVKVTQPLFRLQLVGYIGSEGNYRGTFNNELTGKTFFGTTGRKVPELNLEIINFEAKRRKVVVAGGSTIIEVTAFAVVKDTESGKEYHLDHDKRLAEGKPTVTFKLADGSERTFSSGDTISCGEFTYIVGDLKLEPPSAVVTKTGVSLPQPKVEVLTIPPPLPPPAPASTTVDSESATLNPRNPHGNPAVAPF